MLTARPLFHRHHQTGRLRFLCCLGLLLTVLPLRAEGVDSTAVTAFPQPLDTLILEEGQAGEMALQTDSFRLEGQVRQTTVPDSLAFHPDSGKAIWYAALFPGLGQCYNRRYWKLPIVMGGFVGVSYAVSWNNKYYNAYTDGYRDLIDNDPTTNYYQELLPPGSTYSSSQLNTLFKNRQQRFRRYRDLSVIIGVAWYLVCILDAYVDAELFDFDISDDLSLNLGQPAEAATGSYAQSPLPGYGAGSRPGHDWQTSFFSCSIKF
ncbi:MAG: hypothetical protein IJ154_05105 [Bacteroidales bacterium]|nr:hypothetical protein [Bacteroidales bacterium]